MRWKLVPVEPTEEMAFAWVRAVNGSYNEYISMLAAAPPASQDEELVVHVLKLLRTLGLSHIRHDGIYEPNKRDARAVIKMLEADHG